MIIPELGHVWDNKMKGTFGSFQAIWSGGGPSDELMDFIGRKPKDNSGAEKNFFCE